MMVDTATRVEVESPYQDNTRLFDNPESSNMRFLVPGMEKPLNLHLEIMSTTSNLVKRMMTQEANEYQRGGGWRYDMSREVDRKALEKVMRFCYGENMVIEAESGECCAVIAALYRLQVTCADEAVKKIGNFALEVSKNDLKIGVKLLKESAIYQECCTGGGCGLDKALSQIVLTADNIHNQYETVVENCLMKLPHRFLDMAEYTEQHTKYSEFWIRVEYVKQHPDCLTYEQSEMILRECNWNELNYKELKGLRELEVVKDKDLLDAFQYVLEKTEKERDELITGKKNTEIERQSVESEFTQCIPENFFWLILVFISIR